MPEITRVGEFVVKRFIKFGSLANWRRQQVWFLDVSSTVGVKMEGMEFLVL